MSLLRCGATCPDTTCWETFMKTLRKTASPFRCVYKPPTLTPPAFTYLFFEKVANCYLSTPRLVIYSTHLSRVRTFEVHSPNSPRGEVDLLLLQLLRQKSLPHKGKDVSNFMQFFTQSTNCSNQHTIIVIIYQSNRSCQKISIWFCESGIDSFSSSSLRWFRTSSYICARFRPQCFVVSHLE